MEFGGFDTQDLNFNDFQQDFFSTEDSTPEDYLSFVDEVIFLIHCDSDSYTRDAKGVSGIQAALQGYSSFLKSKIISSSNDQTALILFNTVFYFLYRKTQKTL